MTDDQGYGDLGCHGNPILKTPNLDKLHSESVRFTDFHVSPFCTPTRAALMSGNHPGVTGAYRTSAGRTMMHPSEKTLAHLFAENGYKTGMTGKWHLGDNAPHRPQDRGFQDAVWHRCGGVGQASDYWGNDYFDDTYERVSPGVGRELLKILMVIARMCGFGKVCVLLIKIRTIPSSYTLPPMLHMAPIG